MQTGRSERHVYDKPPSEINDKKIYLRLRNSAAYGLVNAKAKWQVQSYQLLLDLHLGILWSSLITQGFYSKVNDKLNVPCGNILDDILFAGCPANNDKLISGFNQRFTLGTIVHGPGHLRLFAFNVNLKRRFHKLYRCRREIQCSPTCPNPKIPPPAD